MDRYWLVPAGGKDYILDDNLRVQIMRFLVGDIDEIPGLSLGPPPTTMPTDSDWNAFFAGLPKDGLPLDDMARSALESAYPGLVDKVDALCEAIHLTPTMPDIDGAFEVAKIKKFHEKGDEKLVVDSWNKLREILIQDWGRFHLDHLRLLWACDRPHILEELLEKYGAEEPAKMGMLAKEKKETEKKNPFKYKKSRPENEVVALVYNETASITEKGGREKILEEDRIEIAKLAFNAEMSFQSSSTLKDNLDSQVLVNVKRAVFKAKEELERGIGPISTGFVAHNDKRHKDAIGLFEDALPSKYVGEVFGTAAYDVPGRNGKPARHVPYKPPRIVRQRTYLDANGDYTYIVFFNRRWT